MKSPLSRITRLAKLTRMARGALFRVALPSASRVLQEEFFLRQREHMLTGAALANFQHLVSHLEEDGLSEGQREYIRDYESHLNFLAARAELRWEMFLDEHRGTRFRVFAPDILADAETDEVKPLFRSEH